MRNKLKNYIIIEIENILENFEVESIDRKLLNIELKVFRYLNTSVYLDFTVSKNMINYIITENDINNFEFCKDLLKDFSIYLNDDNYKKFLRNLHEKEEYFYKNIYKNTEEYKKLLLKYNMK